MNMKNCLLFIWFKNAIALLLRSSCSCFSFEIIPSFSRAICANRSLILSSAENITFSLIMTSFFFAFIQMSNETLPLFTNLFSLRFCWSSIVSRINESDCSTSTVNWFGLLSFFGGRDVTFEGIWEFCSILLLLSNSASSSLLCSIGSAGLREVDGVSSFSFMENETGS